jgi:uncharacterized membrane protein HdeD (DUF308 family)
MATQAAAAPPQWDRRRLVYGDWSWFVRDGLDVLRLLYVAGTIAFAVAGRSEAGALTAACIVLLVARVADLPRWFDFGLILSMTLIGYGTALGLYGDWFYYDKVVHGISPVGYSPVLYLVLVRLGVVPDPGDAIRQHRVARISGIFIVTLAVGMAVGAGYESVEWIEDKFDILGGHFVKGLWDTETDLLCDTGGSLVGATFLTVWSLRGWTSRRKTVVPAPPPSATPVEAARRFRKDDGSPASRWQRLLVGVPRAVQGAAGVAAGTVLLLLSAPTLRVVGVALGLVLVARALFDLVGLLRGGGSVTRRVWLARLVASAVAGTIVLSWPRISQLALLYAVGAASVAFAAAEAASLSTEQRTVRQRWLGAASSAAAFVFGIAMLSRPTWSLNGLVKVLGVYLIVLGALDLVRAVEVRMRSRRSASDRQPEEEKR